MAVKLISIPYLLTCLYYTSLERGMMMASIFSTLPLLLLASIIPAASPETKKAALHEVAASLTLCRAGRVRKTVCTGSQGQCRRGHQESQVPRPGRVRFKVWRRARATGASASTGEPVSPRPLIGLQKVGPHPSGGRGTELPRRFHGGLRRGDWGSPAIPKTPLIRQKGG